MLKRKLLLKTIPLVVVVVVIGLIRDYVLHIPGVIEFSKVSPLLTAVALIVGFMLAGVLGEALLLISNYKTAMAVYFLISLFSLIYLYLTRLIRDVDAPIAYSGSTNVAGSAEIDPFPLREYRRRLEPIP